MSKKEQPTFQDWEPVVLRKPPSAKNDPNAKKEIISKNLKNNNLQNDTNLRKIDEATEAGATSTITRDLCLQIQTARTTKKMTQTELAKELNVPATTIKDYENGKAQPNGQLLAKMGKILGVTLKNKKKK